MIESKITPYPHQHGLIDAIYNSFRRGFKRTLACAATAFGKTVVGFEIIRRALEKGNNVLWLADRREIVWQTVKSFHRYGIGDYVGTIMAGESSDLTRPVQIISCDTYRRRIKLDDFWFHKSALCIYDEAHLSMAPTRQEIMSHYHDKYFIGFSATPGRSDNVAMGSFWQDIVYGASVADLTPDYLVPIRYYGAPINPSRKGLGGGGEFNQQKAERRMNKKALVGDILDNYLRLGEGRKTLIFAQGVKHSLHIQKIFKRKGIKIEHVDSHTPDQEREDILSALNSGDIDVVTNYGIYCEGIHAFGVSCLILARMVKFIGRLIQIGGRVMAKSEGKDDAIIIDHGNNFKPHGFFLDDPIEWSLSGRSGIVKRRERLITCKECGFKSKEHQCPKCGNYYKEIIYCQQCGILFRGKRCHRCSWEVSQTTRKTEIIDADLVLIKGKKVWVKRDRQIEWLGMFEQWRREINDKNSGNGNNAIKPGWVYYKFKEKFKKDPPYVKEIIPMVADDEFKKWKQHLNIRRIKGVANRK